MLKLNVGLSRKIGEAGYGSRGGSVNVEMELDSGLVAEPTQLQDRIRQLFNTVRTSLAEELTAPTPVIATSVASIAARTKSDLPPTHLASGPAEKGVSKATAAQVRAIGVLAHCKGVDANDVADHHFGVARPDALSVSQASQLIDTLRTMPDPIFAEEEDVETVPF